MKTAQDKQAAALASEIRELERRNDYGGRHSQATRELEGLILVRHWNGRSHVTMYRAQSGRPMKDFDLAMKTYLASAETAK